MAAKKQPAKRGPGQPKKIGTVIAYTRLTEKEEARIQSEVEKTGESKAAIIQRAVRRYFKMNEEKQVRP